MPENVVMQPAEDGLIVSRKSIATARSRAEQPSDGDDGCGSHASVCAIPSWR
jgi:hypothetical protein